MVEVSFSIIIPLFNKREYISDTIKSALSQTYQDFEIIVIDDGSTDGSIDIVRGFNDYRIRVISQNNLGPSATRNVGVENATKEWIVFLDADDLLPVYALSLYRTAIISDNASHGCYSGNQITIETNGSTLLSSRSKNSGTVYNPYKAWFFRNVCPWPSSAFNKKSLNQLRFNEQHRRIEDAEFMFLYFHKNSVYYFPEPTYVYVKRGRQASLNLQTSNDFICHIVLKGKPFWEKICLYELILQANNEYKGYVKYKRNYLLLILIKIFKALW